MVKNKYALLSLLGILIISIIQLVTALISVELFFWIFIFNPFAGVIILATFDTNDLIFLKWVLSSPEKIVLPFLVIFLWPILLFFMLRYHRNKKRGVN